MFRNAGLTLLDERFDQVEKAYADSDEEFPDDDEEGGRGEGEDADDEAPPLLTSREDFNAIMDDFLENYEILGGKMRPVLEGATGADKLATFRRALREDEQEHTESQDRERSVVTPHDSHDDDDRELYVNVSDTINS